MPTVNCIERGKSTSNAPSSRRTFALFATSSIADDMTTASHQNDICNNLHSVSTKLNTVPAYKNEYVYDMMLAIDQLLP
jgi:hypothetical protein